MKNVILLSTLFCTSLCAQNSFRIFDSQMNDVTGAQIYLSDTNASNIQALLTVENIDSVTYQVTAGRLVIQQPAGAANAISWGSIMYVPSADSSALPETMAPGGTAPFVGDYFPNGISGTATINYCFWDRYNVNNNACVTVTFDNYVTTGINPPYDARQPHVVCWPNPATEGIGIAWSHAAIDRVDLYSSDGKLVSTSTIESGLTTEFELTNMPAGIYYIRCSSSVDGFSTSFTFIHEEVK